MKLAEHYVHWTTNFGKIAGHPAALLSVAAYAGLWVWFSPATFEWNAVATLLVWLMTLFIQRSNRRDTLAIQAKLDELLRSHAEARTELAKLDDEEPEDIEEHRKEERAALATSATAFPRAVPGVPTPASRSRRRVSF
jgi:low affinity Fe/Cu permease